MKVGIPMAGMTRRHFLKQSAALSATAGLSATLIAACGGNSSTNGPVDLTLWTYAAVSEVGAPPANWDAYATIRKELNINLKFSIIPQGDDGDTRVSAAAAANNLPDLFQITNNNLFNQWINLGLVGSVDDLFAQMPQRTKNRYSDPTLNKLGKVNGKQYVLQEGTPLSRRRGMLIRQDWLDKLGLAMPTTLDELVNVAKAFTFNDPDGDGKNDTYGFGAYTTSGGVGIGDSFISFFGAFGLPSTWNYNTKGKVSLSVRDPNYLQAMQFLKKLADARAIDPDWTTLNTSDFRARWKQGKYGIISEDFCAAQCQANYSQFDNNFPNGQWTVMDTLQGSGTTSYLGPSMSTGNRMGVAKKALDASKGATIAKFLEWADHGEGYYLLGYGKKGVNYNLDAQGNITTSGVPTPFTSHAGAPLTQLRNIVYNNNTTELKVRYPSYTTKAGRKVDPLQIYNAIASKTWQEQTSSYAIPPASNQSDINRYIDEALIQFVTGQKALDSGSWNAFISGLSNLNVADWESAANQTLKSKELL